MLWTYLRLGPKVKDVHKEDAEKLIEALDHLPLAITHAGSHIAARIMTISRYLNLFRNERGQIRLLNGEDLVDTRRDGSAARTVMATWQISFEAIQEMTSKTADLLKLLCMYDNQGIPRELARVSF